jgi:hypothetical protein
MSLATKCIVVSACVCALLLLFLPKTSLSQGVGTPITGFAWSDTIGWISLNCSNHGSCASNNYGLAIASDGAVSGYAWSDTVGWVSANAAELSGCPTTPCSARMEEFAMQGWLKALSANDPQNGGWDGFISLAGGGYGPVLANGVIDGYAWGDTVVGWVDFASNVHTASTTWLPICATTYLCTDTTHRQNQCAGAAIEACNPGLICSAGSCVTPPAPFTSTGGELTASPSFIGYNQSVLVSWNVEYADSCIVTENNPEVTDVWSTISGNETSSPLARVTTYTLSCTGPGGELTQTATVSRRPDWREI